MNTIEVEQFAALAANWSEAEEGGDQAGARAFEDELHARLSIDEIRNLRVADAQGDEASAAETAAVRRVLEAMWDKAAVRLD